MRDVASFSFVVISMMLNSALLSYRSDFFNTKVDLKVNEKGKGKIIIPFNSNDDLGDIIAILDKLEN